MHRAGTFDLISSRASRAVGLSLILCAWAAVATAQDPLTLRQAVDQALGQSPAAAIARAGDQEAKSDRKSVV